MATTAKQMIQQIEAALAQNVGVAEISVDGQKVRFDRAQLLAELDYWMSRQQREGKKRPLFRSVNLSGWTSGDVNGTTG